MSARATWLAVLAVAATAGAVAVAWGPVRDLQAFDVTCSEQGAGGSWREPGLFATLAPEVPRAAVFGPGLAAHPENAAGFRMGYPLGAAALSFEDPGIAARTAGLYWLAAVEWTAPDGSAFALRPSDSFWDGWTMGNVTLYGPPGHEGWVRFVGAVAALPPAETEGIATAAAQPPPGSRAWAWSGFLPLRTGELYRELLASSPGWDVLQGRDPLATADGAWRMQVERGFVAGPEGEGGARWSVGPSDRVFLVYDDGPATRAAFRTEAERYHARHGLPAPSFEDVRFQPPKRC